MDPILRDEARFVSGAEPVEAEIRLLSIMDGDERERDDDVERVQILARRIGEMVQAVLAQGVRRAQRRLVLVGAEHAEGVERLGAHRVGRRMLDAGLLDAHVDDVGRVVWKGKVGRRLDDQQHDDDRDRSQGVLQIRDYAHAGPSSPPRDAHAGPSSPSWDAHARPPSPPWSAPERFASKYSFMRRTTRLRSATSSSPR